MINLNNSTLIIRATNWLGDSVMTLPALREIRRFQPETKVVAIVRPELTGFYRWITEIDEIVIYRPGPGSARWRSLHKVVGDIRLRRPGAFLCLQNAFEAALMARLAGVPIRIGYIRDGRKLLLTHRYPVPPTLARYHQVYFYLHLLYLAGFSSVDYMNDSSSTPQMKIGVTGEMRLLAVETLRKMEIDASIPIIGIHAGAHYGSAKRWITGRFQELVSLLQTEYPHQILLFGTGAEREMARQIVSAETGGRVFNLCGETTLEELVALIGLCRLFISNDSGPMHVAAALRIPQVAIFGSTDPVATGPFSPRASVIKKPVDCSPCFLRQCPFDLRCFTSVTVEHVLEKVDEILQKE